MKNLLKLEEAGIFLLGLFLFMQLSYSWWIFLVLLLAPDIGMIGYAINTRVGAFTYNLLHHKGLAILLYIAGRYWQIELLMLAGTIMLAHAAMDRVLGYGLKYPDAFKHTHLGWIGGRQQGQPDSHITEAG
jgi:multisubunit Na+/H+ antiporter MnhB subunit